MQLPTQRLKLTRQQRIRLYSELQTLNAGSPLRLAQVIIEPSIALVPPCVTSLHHADGSKRTYAEAAHVRQNRQMVSRNVETAVWRHESKGALILHSNRSSQFQRRRLAVNIANDIKRFADHILTRT